MTFNDCDATGRAGSDEIPDFFHHRQHVLERDSHSDATARAGSGGRHDDGAIMIGCTEVYGLQHGG